MNLTLGMFKEYLHRLPKKMEEAAMVGLERAAARAIPILVRSADSAVPASDNGKRGARDTGHYRKLFKWVRTSRRVVTLYNLAGYAGVIERGRRKGRKMPPLAAIARWAERRLGLDADEAKRAAYPIAIAISKRGLRPRKVIESQRERLKKIARQEVSKSIRGAMKP